MRSLVALLVIFLFLSCSKHHSRGTNPAADPNSPTIPLCTDTWSGTKQFGYAAKYVYINGASFDTSCNYYVAGYTDANLNGLTKTGLSDTFVIKYSSTGIIQWTKLFGAAGQTTYGNAMAVDLEANVYVTGLASGSIDGNTITGNQDMFLVKYNTDGVKQWSRLLGTPVQDTIGYAITTDSEGDIYVAGHTWGNLDSNTLIGTQDLFLTKYSGDGSKLWTKTLGVVGGSIPLSGIAVGPGNVLYIAGAADGGVNGNSLTGTQDSLIVKYDASGNLQWARQQGAATWVTQASAVAVDSNGDVFLSGFTQGSLPGATINGSQDLFITKYSAAGATLWTKQLGGNIGTGVLVFYNSSAIDSDGNVYVAGLTDGAFDGNSMVGTNDAFIAKLSSNGTKVWTTQTGPVGGSIWAMTLSLNSSGFIIAGYTDGSFPGHTVAGLSDAVILPFTKDGTQR